jgi:hypothetical protein
VATPCINDIYYFVQQGNSTAANPNNLETPKQAAVDALMEIYKKDPSGRIGKLAQIGIRVASPETVWNGGKVKLQEYARTANFTACWDRTDVRCPVLEEGVLNTEEAMIEWCRINAAHWDHCNLKP